MNESLFASKIKKTLDTGLDIGPGAAARLKAARERALERHRVPAAEFALTGRGMGVLRVGGVAQSWLRILVPAACLIAAAIGLQQWQETRQAARFVAQQAAEIEEVDTLVLTGDLPIKAYLDEDFQSWLKQASQ